MKPERPYVEDANITQCRNNDMLENQKCVLKNYINMKKERDILRFYLLQVTDVNTSK